MAARNSTTRKRARRVRKTQTPLDIAKNPVPELTEAGPSTRRKPADYTEDLFAILNALVKAKSLIVTAKRSMEHRESTWDEITTLEAAIQMLRRVDMALNDVADGRPSRIRPDEDVDTTDDGKGGP
jgi:hypothetical protein